MIGFYDYTVIATYLATSLSVFGIFIAIEGNIALAVFWLGISAILDTFDGKIARTKKNRSKQEKYLGNCCFCTTCNGVIAVCFRKKL